MLLCLCRTPASGQTQAAVGCEANEACVALIEQAAQQSKAGQLAEAEKHYRQAYEVSHDARLLFNIARVLDKRGQVEGAMSYYRQFIQAPVQDESQKDKAREYLRKLEGNQTSQLSIVSPSAVTAPRAVAPTPERSATPVYRKGWFWGVVVGSVAAVGLGVGLGVGLSNRAPAMPTGAVVPMGTNVIDPTF